MTSRDPPVSLTPHPMLYLILELPAGASSGFVTVTLAYLLSREGTSTEQIAAIVAVFLFPQTWLFLWTPVIDTSLNRKKWYVIGAMLMAVSMIICGLLPATRAGLFLLSGVVFLMAAGSAVLGVALASLIPQHTPDNQRGRAGGWLQAGNLGGSGLGGGAALWMAQHVVPAWTAATALAGACMLCVSALSWIPSMSTEGSLGGASARNLLREQYARLVLVLKSLLSLARSRQGYLGMLILALPIGTGAASNLWAAVAGGWQASGDTVALVNGALGGVASILGCLVGGHCCDRLERKFAYVLFGTLQAICAAAMALAPRTELMYMIFTLAYAFINGMGFASLTAVTLEVAGRDAAATRVSTYTSLANMPVLYMGLVEGWAYTQFGAPGMLYGEALCAAAAIAVFYVISVFSAPSEVMSTRNAR